MFYLESLFIIWVLYFFDIIAITEIYSKNISDYNKPEDCVFKLNGYVTVQNYNGRGLCLFIKKTIDFTHLVELETYFKTSIFIQLKNSDFSVTLGLIYRSPNSLDEDNNNLIDLINLIVNKQKSLKHKLLLMVTSIFQV